MDKMILITALTLVMFTAPVHAQTSAPVSFTLEAEHFSALSGVTYGPQTDQNMGTFVNGVGNGDWIRWDSVSFLDGAFDSLYFYFTAGWPRDLTGSVVNFRIDSPTGPSIAAITNLAATGLSVGIPSMVQSTSVVKTTGVHTLYITFTGSSNFCDVDKIKFTGILTVPPGSAKTYYVSTTGSDSDSGVSLARPFKTINKAASVMKPGSTCYIRQGIYRETVRPVYTGTAIAPLTFRPYGNEDVVISGAELITGWVTAGITGKPNIYKATMPFSLGKYTDQLFVNGKMAWVARSPNVNEAIITPSPALPFNGTFNWHAWQQKSDPLAFPTLITIRGLDNVLTSLPEGTPFHCYIAQPETWMGPRQENMLPSVLFNQPADFFKGGLISVRNLWWPTYFEITQSGAYTAPQEFSSSIATSLTGTMSGTGLNAGGPGWISHVFGLLDSPNEWYRDSASKTVYLWAADGANPSNHIVEAKRRVAGFDLTSKQYINVLGIRFLGTSLTMALASHCVVDNCNFRYVSHSDYVKWYETAAFWHAPLDGEDGHLGVYLSGSYNQIKNSQIVSSANSGVILAGNHNSVTNCIIHSCNYEATYQAGVLVYRRDAADSSEGHSLTIGHNTIQYCARGNVAVAAAARPTSNQDRVLIEYNDFGPAAYASKETGLVTGQAYGAEVSHNHFHGCGSVAEEGAICMEADMGAMGWIIHHNVFWQGETPKAPLVTGFYYNMNAGDLEAQVFNNTIIDTGSATCREKDTNQTRWYVNRNIMYANSDTAPWKFTAPLQRDYSLRAGSPAIDAGVVIPGYVETFKGSAPDLGAYEYGETPWKAGADWTEKPWVYPPTGTSALDRSMRSSQLTGAMFPRVRISAQRIVIDARKELVWQAGIYDMKGALVKSLSSDKSGTRSISTQELVSGLYVVKLTSNGKSLAMKAMIRR